MAHILWVEDQRHWIDKLSDSLLACALDDTDNQLTALDGIKALTDFIDQSQHSPSLALLDARMHDDDQAGFKAARLLRQRWPELPIIYLSEHSGTQVEAQAFNLHSTLDFIAKHQRNIEQVLQWRIKAILRQQALRAPAQAQDCLASGALQIDLITWDIYWAGEKLSNPKNPRRPLPPTPRKILRQLVQTSPRPQTSAQMASALNLDAERFSNAAYRQHIRTLRDALDQVSNGSFSQLCKQGKGLVTCADTGSYAWLPVNSEDTK